MSTETQTPLDLDLPDDALDGWLGQVARNHMSDFPRAYAYLSLLAVASVHVPRQTNCRCNLNVTLHGDPGYGKGASAFRAAHLMDTKIETRVPGSGEGLAKMLERLEGASVLLYIDELGQLFAKGRIETSSLDYVINTLWGTDTMELRTFRNKINVDARPTILGGIVPNDCSKAYGATSANGRYRRTLFADAPPGTQPHLWRDSAGFPKVWSPNDAGNDSNDFVTDAESQMRPVSVHMNSSVFVERDRWVKTEGIDPLVIEPVLRAAVIAASFDGRKELRGDDMGPALALARYQMQVKSYIKPDTSLNQDAELTGKIMRYMERHSPQGQQITLRKLRHDTRADDYGTTMFERTLAGLKRQGRLIPCKIGKAPGVSLAEQERLGYGTEVAAAAAIAS